MKPLSKDDFDQVQLAMLSKRFERFVRYRWIVGPAGGLLTLLVLLGDHALWRRIVVIMMFLLGSLRFFAEVRHPERPLALYGSRSIGGGPALALALLTAGPVLATGGFDSPMIPFITALCFFVGVLMPGPASTSFTLVYILLVVVMAVVSAEGWVPDLIPAILGGGSAVPRSRVLHYAKMAGCAFALAYAAMLSRMIRQVFRQMLGDALDARDEVLKNHEAHSQELTVLAGELAHELKNPLANLKGLAVLVGRDVHGKGVERLGVLQHEIVRMEEILQSFLTFSRPLSPLRQDTVDLVPLCDGVVALHEGIAQGKSVSLRLRALGPVMALCDPRKIKQILINLVQNALEVSPPETTVEIVLEPVAAGGARIEIRDQGPGIPPSIQAHLFEPGTTTKERGSGLGLALARALARQHGGDLSLESQGGGGCTATLVLPAGSPASARLAEAAS